MNEGWSKIGTFALWCIPYALGLAAMVWLGFAIGSRDFFNQLSQEQRRAVYVGATQRPKSKLRIETPNEGPVKISRVDLDGSTAAVYMHNEGARQVWSIRVKWQLIAPDGTLLASDCQFASSMGGPGEMDPGDRAEVVFRDYSGIKMDNRAVAVRFTVENYTR